MDISIGAFFFETHLAVKDSIFRQAKICSELSKVKNYEELKETINSIRHKYEKGKIEPTHIIFEKIT